ncbi:MAG: 50S ribosomal protein L1 [Proteobacteria bacterium]|nr:50S ribosomal protein L1 [Pseudomonadota bacterium]MCH9758593.1 50S ribosomal protein L1 [Pseudomonadota bacterium]
MAKIAKRLKAKELPNEIVSLTEALTAVAGGSGVKFDESVDVAVQLGIDPRKSDQAVRGSVLLPSGTGKNVRVAVVAQAESDRSAASEAGADLVGFEELISEIGGGKMDFDVLLATPDSMRQLAAAAKVLGPRGLMPNPKNKTVTKEIAEAVRDAKAGQVRYRADKAGIIHASVGKASFSPDALQKNVESLLVSLKKAKPASSKGIYLRRLSVSATMGRGVQVDVSTYR